MNLLDWLLVLLVLAYALSGYWQGFVTGAFATSGCWSAACSASGSPRSILGDADPSLTVSLGALFIVIVCASLGQALLQFVGAKIRDKITWQPARAVDAVGRRRAQRAGRAARRVGPRRGGLRVADRVADPAGPRVVGAAPRSTTRCRRPPPECCRRSTTWSGRRFFPRYLEPFAPERIVEVGPGAQRLLTDPDVADAESSVLKIRGNNDCGRGVEGTGFLYENDRLMTNAHVVAGVDEPDVLIGNDTVDAERRLLQPRPRHRRPRLRRPRPPVLPFVDSDDEEEKWVTDAADGVAILGYPQDGPYDVQRGRVRAEQRLRSPDIYGDGTVIREVYSLRGKIRPGNSGGPIVTTQGHVAGVVFAASVSDDDTGYALTWEQVADAAADGVSAGDTVSTGDCAR